MKLTNKGNPFEFVEHINMFMPGMDLLPNQCSCPPRPLSQRKVLFSEAHCMIFNTYFFTYSGIDGNRSIDSIILIYSYTFKASVLSSGLVSSNL